MSENFIEASRAKVKELMERSLGDLRLCAVLIDGTPFIDRQMIVALGIGCNGRKTVLGLASSTLGDGWMLCTGQHRIGDARRGGARAPRKMRRW